jgi:hypothetical protein
MCQLGGYKLKWFIFYVVIAIFIGCIMFKYLVGTIILNLSIENWFKINNLIMNTNVQFVFENDASIEM